MLDSFFAIIPGMAGWPEIVLILVLVLILFGPKRLPEIADAMGKSIRKFKSATKSATDEVKREIDDVGRELDKDPDDDNDKANDTKQT
jgi:sec-independent protein translocase protein TatA